MKRIGGVLALASLAALAVLGASCGPASREDGPEAGPERMLRIGIVMETGGVSDMSINRSAREGALLLATEWKGRVEGETDERFGDEFTIRLTETPEGSDRRAVLRAMAQEGRNLVFAVGFLFSDSLMSVAREFPGIRFVLIDGFVPDLTAASNITCVSFSEHEGAFLMGAAAGLISLDAGREAKVGFIGGMDMPVAHRYLAGFMAGAAWTNPELRLRGRLTWAFLGRGSAAFANTNQAAYYTTSLAQKAGIKVFFNVAGAAGAGVVEAASRLGIPVLGADVDLAAAYAADPDPARQALAASVPASMVKHVDRMVYRIGRDAFLGVVAEGGYRKAGIAQEGISWVASGLPEAYADALRDISVRIVSGEIVVPPDEVAAEEFIDGLR